MTASSLPINAIYLFDSRIRLADRERLIAGLPRDSLWSVLDDERDGLRQILDLLAGHSGLGAIHILGHGAPGTLILGSGAINLADIHQRSDDLAQLGSHLGPNGDILIYGCHVAMGSAGQAAIEQLARLTGADIAASTDQTGAQGDWVLEASTGAIEASPLNVVGFESALGDAVTVASLATANRRPSLSGTVNRGPGRVLEVEVGGRLYKEGDGKLSVSGTLWTLNLAGQSDLALGTQDVKARVIDAKPSVPVSVSLTADTANAVNFLIGTSGNDQITGNANTRSDVAVYTGNRSDYIITAGAGGITVSDKRSGTVRQGTDTLINLNQIKFADGQEFVLAAAQRIALNGNEKVRAGSTEFNGISVDASKLYNGTKAAETFVVAKNVSAMILAGTGDTVDLSGRVTDYTYAAKGSQLQISDGAYTTTVNIGGDVTIRTASGSTTASLNFSGGGVKINLGTQLVGGPSFAALSAITSIDTVSSNAQSIVSDAGLNELTVNDSPWSVAIDGTNAAGQVLTAATTVANLVDETGALAYQWMADGTPISGATNSTYALTSGNVGQKISVSVTRTSASGGNSTSTSPATASVVPAGDNAALTYAHALENTEPGIIVYTPLAGQNYSLSGPDASSFLFDQATGSIAFKNIVDFESDADKKIYNLTINPASGSATRLVLSVLDGNDPLTGLHINGVAGNQLAENSNTVFRTKVADIAVADDAYRTGYSFALGGADKDLFELDVAGKALYLKPGVQLDFETQSAYRVDVSVVETPLSYLSAASKTVSYLLSVADVNEAPASLSLDVRQSSAITGTTTTATKVADITFSDDALGANALSLVGSDSALFTLVDTAAEKAIYLKPGTVLNYESKSRYDVAVQVSDSNLGSLLATAYTFKVQPNGLPVDVVDLQGEAHSLLIPGLDGTWAAKTFGVTRYNTALAVASKGEERILFALDLSADAVMASKSLAAGDYVFASPNSNAEFFIGKVSSSAKLLTLNPYSYIPGTSSLAPGAAYTSPKALTASMISALSLGENYYFRDKSSGVGLEFVVTGTTVYAQNSTSASTHGDWIATAMPDFIRLNGLVYDKKSIFLDTVIEDPATTFDTAAYYKLTGATWTPGNATASAIDQASFTSLENSVMRPGSIARVGPDYVDMYVRLNSATSGLSTKIAADDVVQIDATTYLILAHVDSKTVARGYDQWTLVSNGAVTKDLAFSSDENTLVRTVNSNDASGVWFQVLNASASGGSFTSQDLTAALTLYRLPDAQVATAMTYAANYGAASMAEVPGATAVRTYSVGELTGGLSLSAGQTIVIRQLERTSTTDYTGFVITEVVDYSTGVRTDYFGHATANGAIDKVFALPALVVETVTIGTTGKYLLTGPDTTGAEHAYRIDASTGSLTELSVDAYRSFRFDPALVGNVELGTDANNSMGSASNTARKLIVAGEGADTIAMGVGKEVVGAGLGADILEYTNQASLLEDSVDGGLESSTIDMLRLAPTQARASFDLGAADIRHIDVVGVGADLGLSVSISRNMARAADYNANGIMGDIGVVATVGGAELNAGVAMPNRFELKQGVTVGAGELGAAESLYFGAYTDANGNVFSFGGNDVVVGGSGSDNINGGNGNDVLKGGLGADVLSGGYGADTYVYQSHAELIGDRINGTAEQGTLDSIMLKPLNSGQIFNFNAAAQIGYVDQVIFGSDFVGTKLILDGNVDGGGVITKYGIAASANHNLDGAIGDIGVTAELALSNGVTVDAQDLSDGQSLVMTGTNFNGYDLIIGGKGNDSIHAGAGNDVIVFAGGVDQLWGGAGADYFQIAAGGLGRMVINDFDKAVDKLDLRFLSGTTSHGLSFSADGSTENTLMTIKNGTSSAGVEVLFMGVALNALSGYTQSTELPYASWGSQPWVIG